ncbi:eukaryotic translation initiation factor 2C 2, partial [Trichinella spiralis]|uniref:eukaryotic translation initiation factor 2C 2 n=1 Tax=Trichinella spiralis TaxID=6334 RepID=UPI0001EFE82F
MLGNKEELFARMLKYCDEKINMKIWWPLIPKFTWKMKVYDIEFMECRMKKFLKWNLDNYLYKNNALVIGVDVVHPSAVETHLPSIASVGIIHVVGNVDAKVTKFHASVKLQPAKQELITGFIEQFSERLLEYLDVNGTAPKNIIVYRDGVSEGQFMQVLEEELSALRRACRSVATNYRPLITFIVVQKRHHARFFCCDEAAARGRGKNIPAGTVIDRVVTSPDEHDFFLCSHHGIQGTSRPTRYH